MQDTKFFQDYTLEVGWTGGFLCDLSVAGEMVTATGLVIGGIGLLGGMDWGRPVYVLFIGMLFYTVIVSPGYFAQKGQWTPVVMFLVLFVLAIVSVILVL